MILLAVLLLVLVAAIVLFVVVAGTEPVLLEWEQLDLAWKPSALVVFLLGAVTLLLAVLALAMIRAGTRRRVERRRELKRLRAVEKERGAAAEAERREAYRDAEPTETPPVAPSDASWYDVPPERR